MKIGLNATCLNNRPSGARSRFAGIYGELMARIPDAEFVVYEPLDFNAGSLFSGVANVTARRTPIPSAGRVRKLVAGIGYWRSSLQAEGFDLFEMFSLPLVKAPGGKTLLTIHDVRGVRPESAPLERAAYTLSLKQALQSADHIITVSDAMKTEIAHLRPEVTISVIYNGLDAGHYQRLDQGDLLSVRHRYELPDEFILAVGHFEERKNYLRLIEAVALLRDRGQSCPLVIVGNDSGMQAQVQKRIISAKLDGSVRILSGLSDHELRCLYKLCSLFVFPSAYEGFGIPILEAMAAGCPMVLSDIPAFREVTQNKGVYFSYDDADLMATAIEHVLASNSERERQVAYGHRRVLDFSFSNLGAQMENLYRSLM